MRKTCGTQPPVAYLEEVFLFASREDKRQGVVPRACTLGYHQIAAAMIVTKMPENP
jgi:hypothetical protein